MTNSLNTYQIEKVGNIISFILNEIKKDVSIKRIVKLLFLIDKTSVEKSGAPITWLEFSAWEQGPVPADIYFSAINIMKNDLAKSNGFDKFMKVQEREFLSKKFPSVSKVKNPDLSAFTKYEKIIIEEVITKYGSWNGKKLEEETHKKGDLWDKVVTANGLKSRFKTQKTSNYPIDFYSLVEKDELKRLNFESAQHSSIFESEYC
jgi:uncharacterized phage-associated protein